MPMPDLLAVLAAAVLAFGLGGLWYSPVLFGRAWVPLAYPGKTLESMKREGGGSPWLYLFAFVASLVALATVGFFAEAMGGGLMESVRAGLYAGLGIVATTFGTTYLFGGKPLKLYLIDAGYQIVSLALGGVVYGLWPW